MSSLIERIISDKKNNTPNPNSKCDSLDTRSCTRLKDNYIFECLKFDKYSNIVSFSRPNPKCKVMFDLLKKCRINKRPITFSGP